MTREPIRREPPGKIEPGGKPSAPELAAVVLAAGACIAFLGLAGYDLFVGFDRLNYVAGIALWATLVGSLLALADAGIAVIARGRLTTARAWALLLAVIHLAMFSIFMCFHLLHDATRVGPRGPGGGF